MPRITQREIVLEYFRNHPNQDIPHENSVDWVSAEYLKRTGKKFRDADRLIRQLSQEGYLIQIEEGVYRYEPTSITKLEYFTPKQKKIILKRDNYKCVVCGKGEKDGVTLHADHIKPKDKGGKATVDNGQTLCSQHNLIKKNYNQTEMAKKLFVNFLDQAKKTNDGTMVDFCNDVLSVYEKYGIDDHIK